MNTITSAKTMFVVAWKAVTVNTTNRLDFDNIDEDINQNDVKLDSLVLSICVHYKLSKLQLQSITFISELNYISFQPTIAGARYKRITKVDIKQKVKNRSIAKYMTK